MLIDELVAGGTVYADARGNAVFVLLGKRKAPVGAKLRGTTHIQWRGLAPGTGKDGGYFSAPAAGGAAAAVVLCESAIDAMSCRVLYPDSLCVSTAGARHDPGWLAELMRNGRDIYCGFDADRTGDAMAAAMLVRYPTVRLSLPKTPSRFQAHVPDESGEIGNAPQGPPGTRPAQHRGPHARQVLAPRARRPGPGA